MIYFHSILLLIPTVPWIHGSDHYPGSETNGVENIMLCCPKQNVIDVTGPLCVPTQEGKWEKESEDHCKIKLKNQCPEFNEAECMWHYIPCANVTFPSCRLKYYAAHKWDNTHYGKRTWMEINYVNQYGTFRDFNYIIEVHRNVRPEVAGQFGDDPKQEDYPYSVANPSAPAGIQWSDMYQPLARSKMNESLVCPNGTDVNHLCANQLNGGWADFLNRVSFYSPNNITDFMDPKKHTDRKVDLFSACLKEPKTTISGEVELEDVCLIQVRITFQHVPVTFNYLTCKISKIPTDGPNLKSDKFVFKFFRCYVWHDKGAHNIIIQNEY